MSEYLLLNILILAGPLILSFEHRIRYIKKIKPILISVLVVGGIYIIWDIAATARGDWAFNEKYLNGITIFNLPIEEILFFVTVPYGCIFIYENIKFYFKDKSLKLSRQLLLNISVLLLLSSLFFNDQNYTLTVLIFTSLFFMISTLSFEEINSRSFWVYILISYFPFLIVNYILTSLPIVTYNEDAIWGIRILTIPLEDFFYSFSMLSFYLMVYIKAKKWLIEKK